MGQCADMARVLDYCFQIGSVARALFCACVCVYAVYIHEENGRVRIFGFSVSFVCVCLFICNCILFCGVLVCSCVFVCLCTCAVCVCVCVRAPVYVVCACVRDCMYACQPHTPPPPRWSEGIKLHYRKSELELTNVLQRRQFTGRTTGGRTSGWWPNPGHYRWSRGVCGVPGQWGFVGRRGGGGGWRL